MLVFINKGLDDCKVRKKNREGGEKWTLGGRSQKSEDDEDEDHLLDLLDTFLTSCSDRRICHVTRARGSDTEGLLKLSPPLVTLQNKMHFLKPKV